jgi:hypothetical protein
MAPPRRQRSMIRRSLRPWSWFNDATQTPPLRIMAVLWPENLLRKLLVAVLLWLVVAASRVGAFSSGAGSCDGVGGYHWDTYYNRRIQGLTLSQHGMQFAINNVAFPLDDDEEQGDHIVTVVELTPESNFTALLTIASSSVPFKGALIRVETAETMAVSNGNSTGISSYTPPSFVLEALGDNAQVLSRCSVDTVQAVTHTNNWPKTQLAALLSNVPMEDTLWTMDVTVVECNNATDSIYSHSRYRILTQTAATLTAGTLNSSSPNVNTPLWSTDMPSQSMISLNSTHNSTTTLPHLSFSLNHTAAPTMADFALGPTAPFGPYNTTSPMVAPAPMLPTVLTIQPTMTALPSTTPSPTHSQVCPLCGIGNDLTNVVARTATLSTENAFMNTTTWQPDAVVVFFNTYITCRDLAKNAARYTDHACRAAMAAARMGCGCQPLVLAENDSGTVATTRLPTASPVSNVFAMPEQPPPPPPLPTSVAPTFALESSSDDDDGAPGCVLCPVTMKTAFVQKWSDGQDSVDLGRAVRCSEVQENPNVVVPTLWNALKSCSKVQQAVAQSCGCSFIGSLTGQPHSSSSSSSLSVSLSVAALSMTSVVLCTMYVI